MDMAKAHGEAQREYAARQSANARDIQIGEVENPARRDRCGRSLCRFYLTYFPGLVRSKPSRFHLRALWELQKKIKYGGSKSLGAPRGYGKDTMATIAVLWGCLYGYLKYVGYACFAQKESDSRIADLKHQLETNDMLREDFPAVCDPVRALERMPQRSNGQTYKGEFTRIKWGEYIVLPTIPGSPASGAIIRAFSLSGSIRGLVYQGQRPDFVVISDPQDRDVARSAEQQRKVMDIIRDDIGGLAGHGGRFGCLCLTTVIYPGDVSDQLLDREKSPQWGGFKFQAMVKWPTNAELWEKYISLRNEDQRAADENFTQSRRLYREHREEMDEGAVVLWPDGYSQIPLPDGTPMEESNLQHLYNIISDRGLDYFQREMQNEPSIETEASQGLEPRLVMERLSLVPDKVVPDGCTLLVRAIDIGARRIHYSTLALAEDMSILRIIDYCVLHTDLTTTANPEEVEKDPSLAAALEIAIMRTLSHLAEEEMGANLYADEHGEPMPVSLTLVDASYRPDVVKSFCRKYGPRFRPVYGRSNSPGAKRFTAPKKKGKRGSSHFYPEKQDDGMVNWYLNSDHYKMIAFERFRQPVEAKGALLLFGENSLAHKDFARECCGEKYDLDRRRWVKQWANHFWDTVYMCFAAADMMGCSMTMLVRREGKTEKEEAPPAKARTEQPKPAPPVHRPTAPARGGWGAPNRSRRGGW